MHTSWQSKKKNPKNQTLRNNWKSYDIKKKLQHFWTKTLMKFCEAQPTTQILYVYICYKVGSITSQYQCHHNLLFKRMRDFDLSPKKRNTTTLSKPRFCFSSTMRIKVFHNITLYPEILISKHLLKNHNSF